MALLLHLRSRAKSNSVSNPSLRHHLFSTSNSGGGDGDGNGDRAPPSSNSPFSSYFRDVKDRLKQPSPSQSTPKLSDTRSSGFSFPASSKSQPSSLDEIRKNLSEFRRRTSVPPPGDPSSTPPQRPQISFQEIYKRSMGQNQGESAGNAADVGPAKPGVGGGRVSFDAIRESLRQIGAGAAAAGGGRMGTGWKDSLKLKPSGPTVIGGSGSLPDSVFGREMREKREGDGLSAAMKTEFVKMYSYGELGEKLKKLRPEGKGKGKEWFSLKELNDRLMRLREMEEKEAESNVKTFHLKEIRQVLIKLEENDEKSKKTSRQ